MKLPAFKLLSKEQDRVNNLPLSGSYLIVGPPGTGKTVVALYRARMIQEQGHYTQLVTYSRVLSGYIASGVDAEKLSVIASTYHSWMDKGYRAIYRTEPPKLSDFKYDWQRILAKLMAKPPERGSIPYAIIDEGQDMPKEFYLVANWLSKNLTVFADENQRITDDQCTLEDIRRAVGIPDDGSRTFCLTKNYRNSREIALLAQEFYTGLESGVAELPTRSASPIVFKKHKSTAQAVIQIARFHDSNPKAEIGVLLPNTSLVKKYYNRLKAAVEDEFVHHYYRDRGGKPVGTPTFDIPGINILTYASSKGLEFDAVFLPELQAMRFTDPTSADFRMQFYVLTSRARDRLFMYYTGEETRMVAHLREKVERVPELARSLANVAPF